MGGGGQTFQTTTQGTLACEDGRLGQHWREVSTEMERHRLGFKVVRRQGHIRPMLISAIQWETPLQRACCGLRLRHSLVTQLPAGQADWKPLKTMPARPRAIDPPLPTASMLLCSPFQNLHRLPTIYRLPVVLTIDVIQAPLYL